MPGRDGTKTAEAVAAPLPSGWICLQDCNLSGKLNRPVQIPFVLLHPEVGVALLDVGATGTATDAEAVLRQRLEAARFESIFPGYLPIVHLRIPATDINSIDTILADAFAGLPALSVPGGDAWVSVVRRALTPRDPARASAFSEAPRDPAAWPSSPVGLQAGLPADEPPAARPAPPRMLHRRADTPLPDETVDETAPAAAPRNRLWLWAGTGFVAVALLAAVILALLPAAPVPVADSDATAPSIDTATATPATPPSPPSHARAPVAPAPSAATHLPSEARPAPGSAPPAPTTRSLPAPSPAPAASAPAAPPTASAPRDMAALPLPPPPMPPERPPEAAAQTDDMQGAERVVVISGANFRTGPTNGSRILRTARRGESFRVFGHAPGGWVQVGDTAPQGWIHSSLLREEGAP